MLHLHANGTHNLSILIGCLRTLCVDTMLNVKVFLVGVNYYYLLLFAVGTCKTSLRPFMLNISQEVGNFMGSL